MSIVRVRGNGYDNHADPIAGEPARRTIDGAFTAPSTTADIAERGRQGATERRTLFAPYGTDLLNTDQVEVDGLLFDIDGVAGQWKQPWSGWEAGCTVELVRGIG